VNIVYVRDSLTVVVYLSEISFANASFGLELDSPTRRRMGQSDAKQTDCKEVTDIRKTNAHRNQIKTPPNSVLPKVARS